MNKSIGLVDFNGQIKTELTKYESFYEKSFLLS